MVAPLANSNGTDGNYRGELEFQFTEVAWYEHVLDFFRCLPRETATFVTVTISLWSITEVLMEVTDNRIPLRDFAIPVLLTAFIVAAHRAFSKYRSYVPDALVPESAIVQRIYRKQQCGWQFSLAKQMLSERIASVESALTRIANGAEFIEPRRFPIGRYVNWLSDRPDTLRRIVHAVAIQCTAELPKTISRTKSENQLFDLRLSIDELAKLYAYTERFERECHEVVPPEGFEDVHTMTYGWSNPIREGISKFLDILADLSAIDKNAFKSGTTGAGPFKIVFDGPDNISKFCEKLDDIDIDSLVNSYRDYENWRK